MGVILTLYRIYSRTNQPPPGHGAVAAAVSASCMLSQDTQSVWFTIHTHINSTTSREYQATAVYYDCTRTDV